MFIKPRQPVFSFRGKKKTDSGCLQRGRSLYNAPLSITSYDSLIVYDCEELKEYKRSQSVKFVASVPPAFGYVMFDQGILKSLTKEPEEAVLIFTSEPLRILCKSQGRRHTGLTGSRNKNKKVTCRDINTCDIIVNCTAPTQNHQVDPPGLTFLQCCIAVTPDV